MLIYGTIFFKTSFLMADNIGRIHQSTGANDANLITNADVAHDGMHVDVQCFPLASYIAALHTRTVDYFSLDVEGSEMEILQTIPFNLVDIKVRYNDFCYFYLLNVC